MSNPPPSDHKNLPSLSITKLQSIRQIPSRRIENREDEDDDEGSDLGKDDSRSGDSHIIEPLKLGLNQIRTRSMPSPIEQANSIGNPVINNEKDGMDLKPKLSSVSQQHGGTSVEQVSTAHFCFVGKKVQWSQSKSLKIPSSPRRMGSEGYHAAFAKEMQSPRFQAILRLTSGRKKRTPDIKSFSHELDSKGVRPLPFWKSRAIGRMEEIMVMIRLKFDKLKEEVNADLGIFAGDLVSILESSSVSHPDWKEGLEDLLVLARQCAKLSPGEFWSKCEGIVQNLDDRRQEQPMGTLRQVHTRLLFILSRCTRLVQFQKESGYEEDHVLASHQLSDLGVYPERVLGESVGGKESLEIPTYKLYEQDKSNLSNNQDHVTEEVNTAKSVASSTGSFRMSSWKKLPSAAEKNRKDHDSLETSSIDKSDNLKHKGEIDGVRSTCTPVCQAEHREEKSRRVTWGVWDQHHLTYEDSLICRICEVEIPTFHVEQHSRICTIADRCDLKGLTVNERLQRVADTLEKILESWTPKGSDTGIGSPDVARVSASNLLEELDELTPKGNSLSGQCSGVMLNSVSEADNSFLVDELHNSLNASRELHEMRASSAGSLTPRSPLATPRMTHIEILMSGRRTISEFENYHQIHKLLEIARSVVNINGNDYSTLEDMIEQLEELKYAIQDRKVDALVVETFGRRIEKLLHTADLSGSYAILGDDKPKTAGHSSLKGEHQNKHSVVGTPDYLAPEILLGMGHGATADWCLSVSSFSS
ncbi:hypothetical protein RD792_005256 [Penstemon davidsonii]|uniref:IREH1/IRE-like N-terminal domain-containing protein n=1 Tax=Penstemon davidsonii TaxID=160366 RepID=A0ABR0DJP3_9LAMI|nr:hypothetical protein RD792_005256 [Penstemon davidsonii]